MYRPGTSPVHRMAPGGKLLAVAGAAIALTSWGAQPVVLACASVSVILLYLLAGFGVWEIPRQLITMRWIVVFLWVTQMVFQPLGASIASSLRLVLILLLANLLTLTTPSEGMLNAIERCLRVLRPLGIRPERIALVLALTVTSIPVIAGLHAQIRDAQRARGTRLALHRTIVPLLVLALRHADELAEAIAARGVTP